MLNRHKNTLRHRDSRVPYVKVFSNDSATVGLASVRHCSRVASKARIGLHFYRLPQQSDPGRRRILQDSGAL